MKTAIWGKDYDYHTDKLYDRPVCPICTEPIIKHHGAYKCIAGCPGVVKVTDEEMLEWLRLREEEKTEREDCNLPNGCKGKQTMVVTLRRNPVTLKWEHAGGRCENCGISFIV